AARDLVRVLVELDVGKGQDAAARLGGVSGGGDRATAYERANAGDELFGRKRLAHVVVGARIQTRDPVGQRVARAQHQDRYGAVGAQASGDLQAVEAGQAPVEDDDVWTLQRTVGEGAEAVERDVHVEPRLRQDAVQKRRHTRVVFDHQDRRHMLTIE